MLAQGEGKSIKNFNRNDWVKSRVAYAGEIEVNMKDCTYAVNSASGTYLPDKGNVSDVAEKVGKHFKEKLGDVGPTKVTHADVENDMALFKMPGKSIKAKGCP
jgi:hypothetical protein